ncbi:hypothetical protein [Streptomyces ziwulingensis]|uniref:Uncharacterized protein n=1 Tax=Streptomyces ziwulingensis TaxID=1045501 RepID=A0ABP9D0V5_9ACTN
MEEAGSGGGGSATERAALAAQVDMAAPHERDALALVCGGSPHGQGRFQPGPPTVKKIVDDFTQPQRTP